MEDAVSTDEDAVSHGKLSKTQLSMIIFTLTCAGPFGIEEAVQSGGILYTLIALLAVPIVFAIPLSLMSAELGSMMPSHHGYIIWVFRGFEHHRFGHFLGFFNAIGCIVKMAVDIPIYILLMLFYLKRLAGDFEYEFSWIQQYLIHFTLIIIGGALNIANITTVGNSAIAFTALTLLPFLVGFVWSLPNTDCSSWTDTVPQNAEGLYQFQLFLSTMLWLYTGWDSTGCLSAEIGFNKSKFFNPFLGAIVLDYVGYTLPVLAAITVHCDASTDSNCWDDGYLYTAFHSISPALGWAVAASGFIANFSIYVAEMSVQARSFWALSQPFVLLTESGKMYIETRDDMLFDDDMNVVDGDRIQNEEMYGDRTRRIAIGMLPQWLCGTIWERTGAPVRGVIVQSVICSGLILFDFSTLLQVGALISCVTLCIEMAAFLRLRYTEPGTKRPYAVPGGMRVAWLITVDIWILAMALMVLVVRDNPYFLLIAAGFVLLTVVFYWIYLRYRPVRRRESLMSELDDFGGD